MKAVWLGCLKGPLKVEWSVEWLEILKVLTMVWMKDDLKDNLWDSALEDAKEMVWVV